MLACVLRMHMSNEAVVFWNQSREFRLMLRNDPLDAGTVAFELCIASEEDEPGDITKVLDMEHDGYLDDGMFVVEAYSYPYSELVRQPDLLDDARKKLNEVSAYTLCRCGGYFIKDSARMCLYCQLTDEAYDGKEHFCTICHDSSGERHMLKQACCGQMLHRKCLSTWESTSKSKRCPLCRFEPAG